MKAATLKQLIDNLPTLAKLSSELFPTRNKASALSVLHKKLNGTENRSLTEDEESYLVKELQTYAQQILKQFPVKQSDGELFRKALGK